MDILNIFNILYLWKCQWILCSNKEQMTYLFLFLLANLMKFHSFKTKNSSKVAEICKNIIINPSQSVSLKINDYEIITKAQQNKLSIFFYIRFFNNSLNILCLPKKKKNVFLLWNISSLEIKRTPVKNCLCQSEDCLAEV